MSFLDELKRRNVIRVGAAYIVTGWLVIQVVETIFPIYGLSDRAIRLVITALGIGLVPVLILTWVFELTPEGLKKDADVGHGRPASIRYAKTLDRVITGILALALGYFAFDKFVLSESREATMVERARQEGRSEALIQSYGERSIAVLPFTNMSSDPEQQYFADGVAEELQKLLAEIPELRVISRSSSFSFKGQNVEIPEIARRLNAAHILEGSVRKSGDQIRISTQLIDGRSDVQLWSGTWDRTLGDIFAIQDEIASDVVSNLKLTLLNPLPKSRRTDPQVYALTMQASQMLEQRDGALTARAAKMLDEALAIDPNYIPALHLVIRVDYLTYDEEEIMRRWQLLKERILAIDAKDTVVHAYMAYDAFYPERDIETSLLEYKQVIERNPNNAEILRQAGGVLRRTGFFEPSITVLKRARELDPLCLNCIWNLKETYLAAGMLEKYEETSIEHRAFTGRRASPHDVLLQLIQGDPDRAIRLAAIFDGPDRLSLVAMANHDLGNSVEFESTLTELITTSGDTEPLYLAEVYAYTGDTDNAFRWLEKSFEVQNGSMYKRVFSPFWWNLHGDPRWDELRERLGMSAQRLEAIEFELSLPD